MAKQQRELLEEVRGRGSVEFAFDRELTNLKAIGIASNQKSIMSINCAFSLISPSISESSNKKNNFEASCHSQKSIHLCWIGMKTIFAVFRVRKDRQIRRSVSSLAEW